MPVPADRPMATTYALVPHIQARLLARAIRGDLESYPPFLLK